MEKIVETRIRKGRLQVRMSSEELKLLNEMAERAGLMVGSYVRQLIVQSPLPRQVRRPPIEKRMLAELLGHLGRIGGNVNQLAKLANAGSNIDGIALAASLGDIAAIRQDIHKALGRDVSS